MEQSSKSSSKSEYEEEMSNRLKWRRIGIVFWTIVALSVVKVAVGVPIEMALFLLLPLLIIRIHLVTSAVYSNLGEKYGTRMWLWAVDVGIIGVIMVTKEWSLPYIDELNYQAYDAEKAVKWSAVLSGRLAWALLAASIFHRFIRVPYIISFPLVSQKRMLRMRGKVLEVMKRAIRFACLLLLSAILLSFVAYFFVLPVLGVMDYRGKSEERGGGGGEREGGKEGDSFSDTFFHSSSSHSPNAPSKSSDSTSSTKSSSSDYFMKTRQRKVDATFVFSFLLRSLSRFLAYTIFNMQILVSSQYSVVAQVSARVWEAMWASMVIQSVWLFSSLLLSEHLSFSPKNIASSSPSSSSSSQSRNISTLKRLRGDVLAKRDFSSSLRHPTASLSSTSSLSHSKSWVSWLFGALESSSSSSSKHRFLRLHALLDLYHIAHFQPHKRVIFYEPSSVEGTSDSSLGSLSPFDRLAILTCKHLDFASDQLERATDELKMGAESGAGAGKGKGLKNSSSSSSSSSLPPLQAALNWFVTKRQRLDNNLRRIFAFARPSSLSSSSPSSSSSSNDIRMALIANAKGLSLKKDGFSSMGGLGKAREAVKRIFTSLGFFFSSSHSDPSLSSTSHYLSSSSGSLKHYQEETSMLVEAVAKIVRESLKEDSRGSLSGSSFLSPLLRSLSRLHIALDAYCSVGVVMMSAGGAKGRMGSLSLPPSFLPIPSSPLASAESAISRHWESSLRASISLALYSFSTSYYEHLSFFSFPQDTLDLLQRYVDFVA